MVANPLSGVYGKDQLLFSSQSYGQDSTGHGAIITNESSNANGTTRYMYIRTLHMITLNYNHKFLI